MPGDLILNSLEIQRFRCFRELRIERLGRVNLIVGKNNVGKSTILEALRLYAIDRARRCVSEIPVEERRFVESYATKALIHTWLAWQDDPGTPLGQAITKRYFDADGPHVG